MEGARGTVLGPSWTSFGESLPHDSPSIFPPACPGCSRTPVFASLPSFDGASAGMGARVRGSPFCRWKRGGDGAGTKWGGDRVLSTSEASVCLPGLAAACRVIPVRHRINGGCSFHLIPKTPSQEKPRSLPTVSSAGPHAALRQALLVGALAAVQNLLPHFSNILG